MEIIKWDRAPQEPLLAVLVKQLQAVDQRLFLHWAAPVTAQPAVKNLLAKLDLPQAAGADGIDFVLPAPALPVLVKWVRDQWPTDGVLAKSLDRLTAARAICWRAGRFNFDLTRRPLVYGILNVTPDSFYDGGRFRDPAAMATQVEKMVSAGATVIEVGGQTTKPGGFREVPPAEELARISPAIKLLRAHYPQVAIAVDTYKRPVMAGALELGVDIINDVNAFTDDPGKLALLRDRSTGLVTMHSSRSHDYENLTESMHEFFAHNLAALTAAGIDRERVVLDEGIGYAKVADGYQDFAMMRSIDHLQDFRRPLLVAISRKGFGKRLFNLAKEDRLAVTLVAEAYMYLHGGRVLRVHDVAETTQLVKMLDAIEQGYWHRGFGAPD